MQKSIVMNMLLLHSRSVLSGGLILLPKFEGSGSCDPSNHCQNTVMDRDTDRQSDLLEGRFVYYSLPYLTSEDHK